MEDKKNFIDDFPALIEPYRTNRFIVNFEGIPPYLFQSANLISNNEYEFKIILAVFEDVDIIKMLQELEFETKQEDKRFEISIDILDPTGSKLKTVLLKGCEIKSIMVFEHLDYMQDEILSVRLSVKFETKTIE